MTEHNPETGRQLVHLLVGVVISVGVWFLKPVLGGMVVVPLLVSIVFFYFLPRLEAVLHIHNHLSSKFEREKDLQTLPYSGVIYYGLGIAPAIVVLPVELACAVIIVLSVGDSSGRVGT